MSAQRLTLGNDTRVADEMGHWIGSVERREHKRFVGFHAFSPAADAEGFTARRFLSLDNAVEWIATAAIFRGRYRFRQSA